MTITLPEQDTLAGALADRLAGLEFPADRVLVDGRTVEAAEPAALRRELCGLLYDLWHAGQTPRAEAPRAALRRQRGFEQELRAAVPHQTAKTRAVLGPAGPDPERRVIEIDRVRILVPAADLSPADAAPGDPVLIGLPAARPALSPGFFLVNGSAGDTGDGGVLRLYAHLASGRHAPAVFRSVLETLEGLGASYRAKILSKRESYPRRDALVVYLPRPSWRHVPALVGALAGADGLAEDTSAFAHRIAPGLALAFEPDDVRAGWKRMSFGQHRAAAVARGITRHRHQGAPLFEAVAQELADAGADPADPACNLSSPDLTALFPA
jgi:HopA1 effector protein family